mmetsp:Transcript_19150/g.64147  ORF Transcript_19150/g.64147 Transcript_19150/m.64147 type:complete len:219 (+) Transcript_19150:376-1032(+)
MRHEAPLHAEVLVQVGDVLDHEAPQGLPLVRVVLHGPHGHLVGVGDHGVGLVLLLRPEALGDHHVAHHAADEAGEVHGLRVPHVVGLAAHGLHEGLHLRVPEPLVDPRDALHIAHRRGRGEEELPVALEALGGLQGARGGVELLQLVEDLEHLCPVLGRGVVPEAQGRDHLEELRLKLGAEVCVGLGRGDGGLRGGAALGRGHGRGARVAEVWQLHEV